MGKRSDAGRCRTPGCDTMLGAWTTPTVLVQAERVTAAVTGDGRLELRCPQCGAWWPVEDDAGRPGSRQAG